jgi:hypothetical protein
MVGDLDIAAGHLDVGGGGGFELLVFCGEFK